LHELEDMLRLGQILQTMLAQVAQAGTHRQRVGRQPGYHTRKERLASVPDGS